MTRNNPLTPVPRVPSKPKRASTFQELLSMQRDQEAANEEEEFGSIDIDESEGDLGGYELVDFSPPVFIEDHEITFSESSGGESANLVIWILQYQKRFKLPDISIDVLIKRRTLSSITTSQPLSTQCVA